MISSLKSARLKSARGDMEERTQYPGGQALALMALVLVGLLAMVALVVDGGNAFAQQRASQNGTDAAAEAGAVALANRLVGVTVTDLMVSTAVQDAGADNAVTISSAEYTDVNGDSLNAAVGGGTIPTGAYGVRAFGTRTFDTFIGGVIGITSLTASTKATAVSGFEKSDCLLTEGCALLPIAPPVNETTCATNPARPVAGGAWSPDPTVSIIPLCSSGAGNVGWIDWSFAYGGSPNGGTSATVTSTINPDNPLIHFPTWLQISQTGDTSASTLEAAINRYNGQVVLIPVFSHTCGTNPVPDTSQTLVEDQYHSVGNEDPPTAFGCKASLNDGTGTKMWYYLAGYRSLLLCGLDVEGCRDGRSPIPAWTQAAYLSGSSNPTLFCGTSGGTGCIVGKWTTAAATVGTIDKDYPGGGGASSNSGITVVLIR